MPAKKRWLVATFAGWTLGFVLGIVFIVTAESLGLRETQFPVALGMGTGVGFMQARLIAAYTGERRRWWLATAIGLAAPFVVADVAHRLDVSVGYSLGLYVVLGGFVAGLLQWRILRTFAARAAWWIAASATGWTLAAGSVFFNERFLPRIPGLIGALLYVGIILIGGLLLGAVGAVALGTILNEREPAIA